MNFYGCTVVTVQCLAVRKHDPTWKKSLEQFAKI